MGSGRWQFPSGSPTQNRGNMRQITLSQGKYALVDDCDFESLNRYTWHAIAIGKTFYARRWIVFGNGRGTTKSMHREILGLSHPNEIGDHRDGNGLNNQRSNLRIANRSQNGANTEKRKNCTSKYIGVYKKKNKWLACICYMQKQKYLGSFDNEEDAARCYNEAAIRTFGEFAKLNTI